MKNGVAPQHRKISHYEMAFSHCEMLD